MLVTLHYCVLGMQELVECFNGVLSATAIRICKARYLCDAIVAFYCLFGDCFVPKVCSSPRAGQY